MNKKRFLAILLSLLMLFQALPMTALADAADTTSNVTGGSQEDYSYVTFYANGVQVEEPFAVKTGETFAAEDAPAAPAYAGEDGEGLGFAYWSEQENGDAASFPYTVNGDTVLYAVYKPLLRATDTTWTVTFYNRDAEVHTTVEVEKGQAIGDQMPATIAREDYNAYWAIGEIIDGAQGKEISVTGARIGSGYVPTEDIEVVPDYDKVTYTVTFYKDEDKTEELTTRDVTVDSNYCVNDIPAVPEKTGYTGKWVYSDGDFNNKVAISADTDVWPKYDQNVFTVTFKVGEENYQTDTYYSGDTLTLPTDPVVEGKNFTGWYAGETKYEGGEAVTSNLTLTAAFTEYTQKQVKKASRPTILQRMEHFKSLIQHPKKDKTRHKEPER